jgi:hypothetical protein
LAAAGSATKPRIGAPRAGRIVSAAKDDEAERAGCDFPRLVPVTSLRDVAPDGESRSHHGDDGRAEHDGFCRASRPATRGSIISARIDGVIVATVTNRMYRYGPAGLGSLGYYPVRYPGFTVRPQ